MQLFTTFGQIAQSDGFSSNTGLFGLVIIVLILAIVLLMRAAQTR